MSTYKALLGTFYSIIFLTINFLSAENRYRMSNITRSANHTASFPATRCDLSIHFSQGTILHCLSDVISRVSSNSSNLTLVYFTIVVNSQFAVVTTIPSLSCHHLSFIIFVHLKTKPLSLYTLSLSPFTIVANSQLLAETILSLSFTFSP